MENYKRNEGQFVKPAAKDNKFLRQLKVSGVPEKNEKCDNERLLKDKKTKQNLAEEMRDQLAIEDCFGWGNYASTKQRPILVTCLSILDARLCLCKIYDSKLHGRMKF